MSEKTTDDILKLYLTNEPRSYDSYNWDSKVLRAMIDKPKICNIGIVGAYASGKSSLVETVLNDLNNDKVSRISLADFDVSDDQYKTQPNIEEKIIQKLILSDPATKLPPSKISNVLKNYKPIVSFGISLIVTMLLILGGFWLGYSYFSEIIPPKFRLPVILTMFSIIVIFVFFLTKFLIGKMTVKSLSFLNVGVTLDEKSAIPIISLNSSFVEILDYMKKTNKRVIIFEDIDRFKDSVEIFTSLRELNIKLNLRFQSKKDEKFVFIHVMKNDLMTTENRSKFFDYIHQVIPAANPLLIEGFLFESLNQVMSNFPTSEVFSKKYTRLISQYIFDMRIVNSTINDFITSFMRICINGKEKRDIEKLFSISLYRNMFPKDYAKLEQNSGFIPTFFALKQDESLIEMDYKEIYEKIESGEVDSKLLSSPIAKEFRGFITKEIRDSADLIFKLLKNQFISTDFMTYISSFGDNLSTRDLAFLRNDNGERSDLGYIIDNPWGIIRNMDAEEFTQVKNISPFFIGFVSQWDDNISFDSDASSEEVKFRKFLLTLKQIENKDLLLRYISYFDSVDSTIFVKSKTIKQLVKNCPALCSALLSSDFRNKNNLLIATIVYGGDDIHPADLSSYISDSEIYYDVFSSINSLVKVKEFIEGGLFFAKKLSGDRNTDFNKYIVENGRYFLNFDNLEYIMSPNIADFISGNYTYIKSEGPKFLVAKVDSDFDVYIKDVLLDTRITLQNESNESLNKILSSDDLTDEMLITLIGKMCPKRIDDINNYNQRVQKLLLENKSVMLSWENTLYLFKQPSLDEILIKQANDITQGPIKLEMLADYAELIGFANKTTPNMTQILISKMTGTLTLASVSAFGGEFVKVLIDNNKISFSNKDFEILSDFSQEIFVTYLDYHEIIILNDFDSFFALAKRYFELFENTTYSHNGKNITGRFLKDRVKALLHAAINCTNITLELRVRIVKNFLDKLTIQDIYNQLAVLDSKIDDKLLNNTQLLDVVNRNISDQIKIKLILKYGASFMDKDKVIRFCNGFTDTSVHINPSKGSIRWKINKLTEVLYRLFKKDKIIKGRKSPDSTKYIFNFI